MSGDWAEFDDFSLREADSLKPRPLPEI